uniref:NADAR domain-containing protein n=1 Tax=Onchocerca volvulus TaxID=6282 RepID=A0A8R1TJ61_ONCVO
MDVICDRVNSYSLLHHPTTVSLVHIIYFNIRAWPRYESRGGGRLLRNLPGTMGFRGGRFGYGPMRIPRGAPRFMYGRIMKRGYVQRRPFEFKKLPETAKCKEYAVAPDNIICFSGFQNVFTAQHDFPLEIDGRVYDNVNHFYQLAKTEALCGVTSLLMTECVEVDGSSKSTPKDYNTLARNILKINKVSRNAAEEWRKGPGLEAMQRALLAKVEQCEELRKELMDSGDKLLVHCFGGDDFYASACNHNYIQDWAKSMQSNKVMIKIPMEFPLTNETVLSIPKFGLGRNVLGVIYMQLREMLRDGVLPYKVKTNKTSNESQNMEMQSEELTGPSIVPSVPAPLKNDSSSSDGFIIGGGSIQSSMKSRSTTNTTSRNVLSVPLEYLASFSSK